MPEGPKPESTLFFRIERSGQKQRVCGDSKHFAVTIQFAQRDFNHLCALREHRCVYTMRQGKVAEPEATIVTGVVARIQIIFYPQDRDIRVAQQRLQTDE